MLNRLYNKFLKEVEKIQKVSIAGISYRDNAATHLVLYRPTLSLLCEVKRNDMDNFFVRFEYNIKKNKEIIKKILQIKHNLEKIAAD